MSAVDLKSFPLLSEFDEEDRRALADVLEPRSVHSGRSAFREGSEGDALLFLAEGSLCLKSKRCDDLGKLGPGAALGGLSLVVLGPRESTAVAETDCELLVLPRSAFPRLFEDAPRTACRLLEALLGDLARVARESLDSLAESDDGARNSVEGG